jgi:NADPH-dependent glutamate synthase beta subunit-like oxidoreductase
MINLFLNKVSNWRMWNHPDPVPTHESDILPKKSLPVLVVGGGLTAVQVALKELSRRRKEEEESETPHVILLSERRWPKSMLTSMWSGLICERGTNA